MFAHELFQENLGTGSNPESVNDELGIHLCFHFWVFFCLPFSNSLVKVYDKLGKVHVFKVVLVPDSIKLEAIKFAPKAFVVVEKDVS